MENVNFIAEEEKSMADNVKRLYEDVHKIILTHCKLNNKAMCATQFLGYNGFKRWHRYRSKCFFELDTKQATILKQTALSSDCDVATNRGVLDNSVELSDCVLSGTISQIETVAKKLLSQPFSMSKLSENILELLENEKNPVKHTKIMGILNLTPDSFSDGGEFVAIDRAMNHAIDMIEHGADVIDIGAQSTRPNADLVSVNYEIEKTVPVITALKTAYPQIELSVDTMTLACAQAALDAGADIINDVSFLKNEAFIDLCKKNNKKLIIMHSRGNSKTMDKMCDYNNVVDDIYKELYKKTSYALESGLDRKSIIIDLGFGFAKTNEQNFALLNRIKEFHSLGYPILAGVSRKRFLQDVLNTREPKDADIQTALATSFLIEQGVEYIRVHDVELSIQAVKFQDKLFNFNQIGQNS